MNKGKLKDKNSDKLELLKQLLPSIMELDEQQLAVLLRLVDELKK